MLWKSFLLLHDFWVQKCKNHFFKEIFNCNFYQIEVQEITNLSSRLEKTPNTWIFAYDRFLRFFKKATFPHFEYFRKLSAAHTYIIVCVLFHVKMFGKAHYRFISPFSSDNFSGLVSTPVLTRKFKGHLNSICKIFFLNRIVTPTYNEYSLKI